MKKLLGTTIALLGLVALAGSSQAQLITWGAATDMGTDTDVSTTGTYLDAATFYNNPNTVGGTTPVNGVTFNPLTTTVTGGLTDASGDIALTYNGFPLEYSPYAGGSPDYNNVVSTLTFSQYGPGSTGTVTLSGLTPGQTYQVEVWAFDGNGGDSGQVDTQLSGNTPVAGDGLLNGATSATTPYVGQYVLGTLVDPLVGGFTTDSFSFTTAQNYAVINDVSVRDITDVPEPSTWAMMLGGLGVLAFYIRRKADLRK